MGQRRAVDAGVVQGAVGEPPVEVERAGLQLHADERVEGVGRPGRRAVVVEAAEADAQPLDRTLVDRRDPGQRLVDVVGNLYIADAEPLEGLDQILVHVWPARCAHRRASSMPGGGPPTHTPRYRDHGTTGPRPEERPAADRPAGAVRRPRRHAGARRPGLPGRPQRLGQVDAAARPGRPDRARQRRGVRAAASDHRLSAAGAAAARRPRPWPTSCCWACPRPSAARPPATAPTSLLARARHGPGAGARGPVRRRDPPRLAGPGAGRPSPRCCCSTSPPTISTCRPSNGWRSGSRPSAARSS